MLRITTCLAVCSISAKIEFVSKMAEELVLMIDAGLVNNEELLLFDSAKRKRNPHGMLPYRTYDRFFLEDLDESQCFVKFRFKMEDSYNLAAALRLPEVFRCKSGVVVDSVKALCICLKRLFYPCGYADVISRLCRPVPQLCVINNRVIDYLVDTQGQLLGSLDQPFLS